MPRLLQSFEYKVNLFLGLSLTLVREGVLIGLGFAEEVRLSGQRPMGGFPRRLYKLLIKSLDLRQGSHIIHVDIMQLLTPYLGP